MNNRQAPFKRRGFHCSIRNKRRVSNKRWDAKWVCLTYCMHAEFNCKFCDKWSAVHRVISLSSKLSLTIVHRVSFGASDGGRQPYHFAESVLGGVNEGHRCCGRRSPVGSTQRPCRGAAIKEHHRSTILRNKQ